MDKEILKITGLAARVEEKEILHGVDLEIKKGEIHVLMGPNGAGKSTLGQVLMGNPRYQITDGSIFFQGKEITEESVDKRAKQGMFLSFQEQLEVPGLPLRSFLKKAVENCHESHISLWNFKKEMEQAMELLQMDVSYQERGLNEGFSGGEKKKAEILQMLLLKPQLAILDETDSGLDVDAVRLVSKGIEHFIEKKDRSLLIITHSTRILEHLQVDRTHIMVNGTIVASGDGSLVEEINRKGYEAFEKKES